MVDPVMVMVAAVMVMVAAVTAMVAMVPVTEKVAAERGLNVLLKIIS